MGGFNLGYVIPSFLDNSGNKMTFDEFMSQNNSLKIGQVTKINYPDDENNAKNITYDVMITERTSETINHLPLTGCVIMDMFGGLADYLEYTLRANQEDMTSKGVERQELLGSYVLVLYQNGSNGTPVIIGGSPNADFENSNTKKRRTKEDGHFLNFVFNGVNVNINKSGELLIRKDGPTKPSGLLDDKAEEGGKEEQAGSLIQIDKDGNINITASEKNLIVVNKKDKEITIDSDAVNINQGDQGAARKEDEIKSTNAEDSKFWTFMQIFKAMLDPSLVIPEPGMGGPSMFQKALGAALTPFWPDSITGKITKASGTVKIGD